MLFLITITYPLTGQTIPQVPGARASGLGNASVTLADHWAIFTNVAAISQIQNTYFGFGYNTRFQLQELTTFGACVLAPFKKGVAGVQFSRYGTGALSIQQAGLGFAKKINFMSLGLKLNYLQYAAEGLGSKGTFIVEAGGLAELLPKLHFGASIYNINQAQLFDAYNERVPVVLKAGIMYLPTQKLRCSLETEKDVDFPNKIKAGLEYDIMERLSLRTGISTASITSHFGLGFKPGKFELDYAFTHNQFIGASHHISTSFKMMAKK